MPQVVRFKIRRLTIKTKVEKNIEKISCRYRLRIDHSIADYIIHVLIFHVLLLNKFMPNSSIILKKTKKSNIGFTIENQTTTLFA